MSSTREFRKLAVIGAGNMGAGIAQKIATEGFAVELLDVDEAQVGRGLAGIRRTLAQGIERKLFDAAGAEAILARIHGTTRWEDLADVDLAVEAVFEDAAVKRGVFERLDAVTRPTAILATNTSSLSVGELAAATRRPERVLGLHYFYHPAKNRLVEVVPGAATDPAAVRAAWLLQEQIGKTPIASGDAPGFVVNRFFVPWLNEAVRLVEERLASIATIEEAAKKAFGVGMGPFELMNVTGVPIALHAATTLGARLGPLYAPAPLLARQVAAAEPWALSGDVDAAAFDAVTARLLAVTFYVAAALVDERVGTLEDTDIGARVGLRWPRGPFELANRHGVAEASRLAAELAGRWDLSVPRMLTEQASSGQPFRFRLVSREVHDGIATLTIHRPDAMNALNETVVAQLHQAFREAVDDPQVRGIVLAGAGKAFVAGADIRFFVRNIESGQIERIVEFTRAGWALLDAIDTSPKPVIARLHGLALGGGLELALACDRIVATPRATVAFPETGIGIYPGLGGTERTPQRIGAGLAKWLIYGGETLAADQAAAIGLVDRVVEHDQLEATIRREIDDGLAARQPNREVRHDAEYAGLARVFAAATVDELLAGTIDAGGDARLTRALTRVRGKAPLALRISGRLIDDSVRTPQQPRLSLDSLREIFASEDAFEGLSSLGKRKPVFKGR